MVGLGGEEEKMLKRGALEGFDGVEENKLLNVGVEGREFGFVSCCEEDCLVKVGAEEDEDG